MLSLDVQTAGIGGLGGQEILLILLVALVLFGGKKIPEMAKGLGEGIKNFKQTMREEDPKPTPTPSAASDEKKTTV